MTSQYRQLSNAGQLRRVARQLRIEEDILTKSGRHVLPPSMRKYVISEYLKSGHLGAPKLLDIIISRFYWPGMRIHLTTGGKLDNHVKKMRRPLFIFTIIQ